MLGPALRFPVLQVNGDDSGVVLLDERDRVESGGETH
jgi:hypothetical protein